MANNLGNLGTIVDLSSAYAHGSFQVDVTFNMYNLTFRAQRFVRTDIKIDTVYLYIVPPPAAFEGWDEYLKTVDLSNPCAVGKRALHLLGVAQATSHEGIDERFAALELA